MAVYIGRERIDGQYPVYIGGWDGMQRKDTRMQWTGYHGQSDYGVRCIYNINLEIGHASNEDSGRIQCVDAYGEDLCLLQLLHATARNREDSDI